MKKLLVSQYLAPSALRNMFLAQSVAEADGEAAPLKLESDVATCSSCFCLRYCLVAAAPLKQRRFYQTPFSAQASFIQSVSWTT